MTSRHCVLSGLVAVVFAAAGCTSHAETPKEGARAATPGTQPASAPAAAAVAAPSPSRAASPAPQTGAVDSTPSLAAAAQAPLPAQAPASGGAQPATAAAPGDAQPATATVPAAVPASLPGNAPAPAQQSASASPASAPAPADESPEMVRRRAQIQWALRQDEFKHDPHGQWAVSAKASSSYSDAQGTSPHAPGQATGVPDVDTYGSTSTAWQPKSSTAGIEWLEVAFAKPVHATALRVRESCGSGAVIKIELFDEQGAPHTVWSGVDPTKDLDYLVAEFAATPFKAVRAKITLATNLVSGVKQIDAVQLVGSEQ